MSLNYAAVYSGIRLVVFKNHITKLTMCIKQKYLNYNGKCSMKIENIGDYGDRAQVRTLCSQYYIGIAFSPSYGQEMIDTRQTTAIKKSKNAR